MPGFSLRSGAVLCALLPPCEKVAGGVPGLWVRGTPYSIIDRGVKARQGEVRNVTLNY